MDFWFSLLINPAANPKKTPRVIVQPLKHKDTKKGNRFAIYDEYLPESNQELDSFIITYGKLPNIL